MKRFIPNYLGIVKVLALMVGSIVATLVAYQFLGETASDLLQALVHVIQ
jgi:hypothetical protein